MNYALVQRLHAAGFPSLEGIGLYVGDKKIPIPTVEKLMEEIGELLFLSQRSRRWWYARVTKVDKKRNVTITDATGKTPREALALLYLELHEL